MNKFEICAGTSFGSAEAPAETLKTAEMKRSDPVRRRSWPWIGLLAVWMGTTIGPLPLGALDWPQWRGPDRTDVSKETGLLKSWPTGGSPKLVWLNRNGGLGYAGFSVVGDRVFTMGLRDDQELVIAVSVADGKELWSAPVGVRYSNRWGDGPRTTPTVDGDFVYAMGGRGDLICVRVTDGSEVWRASMTKMGGEVPGWGYCESVLVDGDLVICTPGGSRGALAALDKRTGTVRWRSKDFKEGAQYASPLVIEHGGRRQYVQLTMKALVGVGAADGAVLWKGDFPGQTAVIPTPIFRDGIVYATAGYGVGSKAYRLGPNNKVQTLYENKVMKNHHGGVVLVGDHIYGHSDGAGWVCQNFQTGEEVWAEKERLGKGAISAADGMLYLISESDGTVVLLNASSKGWDEKGRFRLDPQTEQRSPQGRIWTHPVISNGRLYLRDQELLFSFDIRAN